MASYCGWFFLPRRRFFRPSPLTGSPKMDRSTMIHDIPINCGLVWRKGTIAHSITWYIYMYIYIYYIYTSFSTSKIRFWMFWGVVCHFSSVFLSRVSMGWNSPYDLPVGQRGRWWALWRPTRRFQRRRLMHWQSEKVDDGWWWWLPSGKLTYIAIENHPC